MTCEQVIAFLTDYLDGLLPSEVVSRFEAHLAGCASCTAYIASYRETIRMARMATKSPMLEAGEVPEELIAAILASAR
jgi:anti-sigma factor RsiW